MRSVIGIHTAPDGVGERRAARLKVGLKGSALMELGSDLEQKGGEPLALAAPGAVVREVSVPFADWRKATQVAPYEVEGQVPYDLDDAVTALARLSADATSTRLLVGVATEDEVGALVGGYGDAARQVQAVVPEAWAIYCFGRAIAGPEGKVLLADVRRDRVTLLALNGRQWAGTRTVPLIWRPDEPLSPANMALLRRAAQSLYGGRDRPDGMVVTGEGVRPVATSSLTAPTPAPAPEPDLPATGPQDPDTVFEAGSLARETLLDLPATGPQDPDSAPEAEFLTRDDAAEEYPEPRTAPMAPGVAGDLPDAAREGLAEALGVPLLQLSDAPGFDTLSQGRPAHEISVGAVAIGLALSATGREPGLNLRAGALSLDTEAEDAILRRVTGIGIGLLILMLLFWGDGWVRKQAAQSRLDTVTSAMEAAFLDAFPSVTRVVDPLLQARTEVKQAGARSLLYGPGGSGALAYLNAVSGAIPREVTIGVREFSVSGGKMNMEAEALSFDAIDQIKAYIEQAPEFEDVKVSNATTSAKENRVKFRVSAVLTGEM
ncbi:MAG: hypothetical protein OEY97_06370 [Nitrospirota bacterium]|nr:hypothetical protein [Nitrospirota bacterium]